MFDCFDRHLITISSSTYPSVRSFRFQDLLSKSTSLRHVTIDVQEKVLSHQIQFSFGPKLKELVITGSTLINILPDAFLGNRILLSYSSLFCCLSFSIFCSLSLFWKTFFCCSFLLSPRLFFFFRCVLTSITFIFDPHRVTVLWTHHPSHRHEHPFPSSRTTSIPFQSTFSPRFEGQSIGHFEPGHFFHSK